MTYDELDFYSWYEKMVANEVESALVSEVFVYIFLKNEGRCIRSKTFDFEIWADRFLALDWSHVTVENFRSEFSEVFAQRRAVMNGILVRDAVEKKLSRFGPQNFAWARVWQEKYAYVEKCMREFSTDEDLSKLYAEFSLFEEEGVLFDSEARAFDRVNERFHSQFGKLTEGCEREMHLQ